MTPRLRDLRNANGTHTRFSLRFETLEDRRVLAPAPQLVADIAAMPTGASDPYGLTVLNDVAYFTALDGLNGRGLWRTDGTQAGTWMVRDATTTFDGWDPQSLVVHHGKVYFSAKGDNGNHQLWETDGTSAGTKQITRFDYLFSPSHLTSVGARLFFQADSRDGGRELWASDGFADGTYFVKDIRPGYNTSFINSITALEDIALFTADDGVHGREVWRSDGTTEGTYMLRDFHPGASGMYTLIGATLNGDFYFSTQADDNRVMLWRTDGTEFGTNSIAAPMSRLPNSLVTLGDFIYGMGDSSLWRSNGTVDGTSIAVDFQADPPLDLRTTTLHVAGGKIYINTPWGLYASDGSQAGTAKLPVAARSKTLAAEDLIYFVGASAGSAGWDVWVSDGSIAGTRITRDLPLGTEYPELLGALGSNAVFSAFDLPLTGNEPWFTDGTFEGTYRLADINSVTPSSDPHTLINLNGILLFLSDDQIHGEELWKIDPETRRPEIVKDIRPGWFGSRIQNLFQEGRVIYFSADDGTSGRELWRTDGTTSGTTMIDLLKGTPGSSPSGFVNVDGVLYFWAGGEQGYGLWKMLPSSTTPQLISYFDGPAGYHDSYAIVGSTLYFAAPIEYPTRGGLWRTDGTPESTYVVRDLWPSSLHAHDQAIYFTANDGQHGDELWKSDGSAEGTAMVKDLFPGRYALTPRDFVSFDGRLLFSVPTGAIADGLWTTDGTEEGTIPVTAHGRHFGTPHWLRTSADEVTFADSDGSVWSWSKGNATPTLYSLPPWGAETQGTSQLLVVGGVSLIVSSSLDAMAIWRLEGDDSTPVLATLLTTARVEQNPPIRDNWLVLNGREIYFTTYTRELGRELWRIVLVDGDTNFDGLVDLTDLNNVRNHFGESGNVTGDANGDGVVDLADLNAVRNNFGGPPTVPSLVTSKAQTTQLQPSSKPLSTQAFDVIAHLLGTDRDGFIPLRRRPERRVRQF